VRFTSNIVWRVFGEEVWTSDGEELAELGSVEV